MSEKKNVPRKKTVPKTATRKKQQHRKKINKRQPQTVFHQPIDHTARTLARIKRLEDTHIARSNEYHTADAIAFWIFLTMAVLSNFFLSFIIVFLIVFLYDALLYILIAIIGLSFGILYSFFLHSIKTHSHHHIYAKVFMLLTGGINVLYIITTSAIVMEFVDLPFRKLDVVLFSLTYFITYLLPYTIKLFIQRATRRSKAL